MLLFESWNCSNRPSTRSQEIGEFTRRFHLFWWKLLNFPSACDVKSHFYKCVSDTKLSRKSNIPFSHQGYEKKCKSERCFYLLLLFWEENWRVHFVFVSSRRGGKLGFCLLASDTKLTHKSNILLSHQDCEKCKRCFYLLLLRGGLKCWLVCSIQKRWQTPVLLACFRYQINSQIKHSS